MSTSDTLNIAKQTSSRPRYDAYKDSGVEWLGEIPQHWEIQRLKRTVTGCKNGYWGDTPEGDDSDVPVIRVADFDRFALRIPEQDFTIRSVPKDKRSGRALRSGDLLLEKSGGGDKQPVGAVVLYDLDMKAVSSNFIGRMRVIDEHDSSYLRYLYAALYDLGVNERAIKQSIGIQNLDADYYLRTKAPIPPLPEQRAIAAYLDRETERIDALVEKKERLIELLEEKRTAVISHAVTKGLDADAEMKDSGVEWLGEIPAGWEVVKLKYLAHSLQTGPFGSQLHSGDYISGGTPVLNPSHLRGGQIDADPDVSVDEETRVRLSRHELESGDVVFARRGELGRCAIVTEKEQGWLCGTGSIRFRPKTSLVEPAFINLACSTNGVAEWFVLKSVGSTMDNLNTDILGELQVAVPPLKVQREITELVGRQSEQIQNLVVKVRDGIDRLKEYRTALISAAVTGRIDVRDM